MICKRTSSHLYVYGSVCYSASAPVTRDSSRQNRKGTAPLVRGRPSASTRFNSIPVRAGGKRDAGAFDLRSGRARAVPSCARRDKPGGPTFVLPSSLLAACTPPTPRRRKQTWSGRCFLNRLFLLCVRSSLFKHGKTHSGPHIGL